MRWKGCGDTLMGSTTLVCSPDGPMGGQRGMNRQPMDKEMEAKREQLCSSYIQYNINDI